ncbi:MAG TPA: hypothetical protein PLP39_05070 [Flavobacterium lutivivi]|nr:hypothetical protein [Flavobacterium lutivivi]
MKFKFSALLVVLGMTLSFGQEENEVQNLGDNFSLEGALAMFKKANSLEEFEKLLNEENNNVNNLDLNNDNDIDYITVEDIKDGDNHVIVLSTFIADKEKQDIATIGIEKTGNESAVLQIEGDIDLYAENTLIEPADEKEALSGSTKGPNIPEIISRPMIINVWFWPSVRFLYAPNYVVWVSPYHWGFYPRWWKPWRPFRHTVFVSKCVVHKTYFRPATTRRVTVVKKVYTPRRHSSTLVVHNRRGTTVVHKNRRGNVKAVKVKRTPVRAKR